MKQNIRYKRIKRITSATFQYMMLWIVVVLMLAVFPLSSSAQFIKIILEIPAKTGQTDLVPFHLSQKADINTGLQTLSGTCVLCINAAENLQVQATFTHSDSLRNETGQAIPVIANLSFRNDGKSQPPGKDAGHVASFPLSDCGRIIEYIKGNPQVLNAFLFLKVNATIPKGTTSVYTGDISLIIEYN